MSETEIQTRYVVEVKGLHSDDWYPLFSFSTERDAEKYLDGLVLGRHNEPSASYRIVPRHSVLGSGLCDGP